MILINDSYTLNFEIDWDLGLSTAVLMPDKYLLERQIQRNYKGLKISVCVCSWGKL